MKALGLAAKEVDFMNLRGTYNSFLTIVIKNLLVND